MITKVRINNNNHAPLSPGDIFAELISIAALLPALRRQASHKNYLRDVGVRVRENRAPIRQAMSSR